MADGKRIIDLNEAAALTSDMNFAVDSEDGTKKLPVSKLIDSTLTEEGMAAGAKAVGDAITAEATARQTAESNLQTAIAAKADTSALTAETEAREEAITDLKADFTKDDNFYEDRVENGEYKLAWTNGKCINTLGGVGSHNSCSATLDYIPIRSGDVLSIYCHAPGTVDVIAVYDKSKTLVEQFTHNKTAGVKSYTVVQDGFIRLSNEPNLVPNNNCYLKVTNLGNINAINNRISTVENAVDDVNAALTDIKALVPYSFDLSWTTGKYIQSANGDIGNASVMACTLDYYPVFKDQQLYVNLSAYGVNECAIAFYNSSKAYQSYVTSEGESVVTVPVDGFARFSTKTTEVTTTDAYVYNYIPNNNDGNTVTKKYFVADTDQFIMGATALEYNAVTPKLDYRYKGEVTPAKRFLAIGFDDFRASDFNMIVPLFEKYGGRATFNRPISSTDITGLSDIAKKYIDQVIWGNHEMGDHTIFHYAFPYEDALFNGQDPNAPDGNQTEYPTNAQMRTENPDTPGSNYFRGALTNTLSMGGISGLDSTILNTAWEDLTDEQCQTIRETFSSMKNPTLAPVLDELSNHYLGTTGRSAGSWDGTQYTGGIFTGCKTSANHEIWERILTIVQMYYKEKYGLNWELQCWSWPGSMYFGIGLWRQGSDMGYYYDQAFTQYYNMNARFVSSLYTDELGNPKTRSFADVLREFGYKYSHDFVYPSRLDYQQRFAMRTQFYLNEQLSKKDGVLYPTNRSVSYNAVSTSYPDTFFTTGKTKAAQMYDSDGGAFRTFIEALRRDTANGIIHSEVIDSVDNYSSRIFFEEALRFCKSAGIEVITKAEAFDICFNHPVENGNLIYNPMLKNSAEEFFADATNVPTNPDGYTGSCSVTTDADGNILVTSGDTTYLHYGVPLGKLIYSADVKGTGTITFKLIKCGTKVDLSDATALATITVDSSGTFTSQTETFVIPNNPLAQWTQSREGLDNKAMGLMIVYSTGLQIKNIRLEKA